MFKIQPDFYAQPPQNLLKLMFHEKAPGTYFFEKSILNTGRIKQVDPVFCMKEIGSFWTGWPHFFF